MIERSNSSLDKDIGEDLISREAPTPIIYEGDIAVAVGATLFAYRKIKELGRRALDYIFPYSPLDAFGENFRL